MKTYDPKQHAREYARPLLPAAPAETPVESNQDVLGAAFYGDALSEASSPLHALIATQVAFEAAGGFAPAIGQGSNAGLMADLNAFASSPAVARKSLARGVSRRGPLNARYDLPDAAKDGEGMRRQLGGGMRLEDSARLPLEAILGQDLSSVRIHAGGKADSLADSIDARAFTIGEDVVFADGEFSPDTHEGKQLLVHELTHVLQFRRGDANTRSDDPRAVKSVEDEADRNAARAGMLMGQPTFQAEFSPEAIEARTDAESTGMDTAVEASAEASGIESTGLASASTTELAPASGTGAVAARSETSELAQLIHRYRRCLRRVRDADAALAEFRAVADPANQQEQAANVSRLESQRATNQTAITEILARITALKGQTYTDAIVAKYTTEQEEGGWQVQREGETSRQTGGRTTRTGTATTASPTTPGTTPTTTGNPNPSTSTPTGSAGGTNPTTVGTAPATQTSPSTPTGAGQTGQGGGAQLDGQTVRVGNGTGVNTGVPAPPPTGNPGAHLDAPSTPGTPASTTPPQSDESAQSEEGRNGPPQAGQVNSGNRPARYELYEGTYADVYMDVAYLDYQGTLRGDPGQGADLPELLMELRQAHGIGDVVHVLSQFDPSKFRMTGEIRAALDLIRAELTVDGAPLPLNIGGQEFLLEWMLKLSARAYAEIYATGAVNPDLSNLSLNVAGSAGAKAVAEAGATLVTAADWLGDSYAPLMSVSATAAGSAGASAELEAHLNISPEAIEIGYRASATWGLGGSLSGKLKVCVLPVLELIATYMGIDVHNLPEPLAQVYEAFKQGKDIVQNILAAWNWLADRRPLQMAADLLTSEAFWRIFDSLVEMGVDAIDLIGWIRQYVVLGETPGEGTICGLAFQSEFLWYLLSFGMDFLTWVQARGKEVIIALLPIMREASRAVLTFIIRAGPWIIDLIQTSWATIKRVAEFLGEQFGPVLDTLKVVWEQLGAPVFEWVLDLVGRGFNWVVDLVRTHGPPIVAWLQTLPGEVQAFFEHFTPIVVDALYRGGQFLVEAVATFGRDVLAYIEQWAPGVVALFSQMGADAWNAIKGYGIEFFRFCVQVGQNALQLIGPYAARLWEYIRGTAVPAVMDFLVTLCRDYLPAALRILDETAMGLLRAVINWVQTEGPGFASWIAQNLGAIMDVLQRAGAAILPYLESLTSGVREFLEWLATASAPVVAWLVDAGGWLVEQLQAQGRAILAVITDIAEFLQPLWALGREAFLQALELIKDGARWLASVIAEYGPAALAYLRALSAEALALFTEATKETLRQLIAAGQWTIEVLTAIGAPLIPILQHWGAQLAELGATVAHDLVDAWNRYGEPVFTFLLRIGRAGWDALGQMLSRALPVIDRFVREGVSNAVEFITVLCRDYVGPALTLVIEASAETLTEIYTWATTDGVELAARIGRNAARLAQQVAQVGQKAWHAFLEFGEWVLDLGQMAAGPFYEVLERWGPRYRDLFIRYGVPIVRFISELGDAAAELLGRLGEAICNLVVELGERVYRIARDIAVAALEKAAAVGAWLWDHLVEFGQQLLTVLQTVGEAVVRAWQQYGRPVVRFFVEVGQAAIDLLTEIGEQLYRLVARIGEAIWTWARETIPPVLRKLVELGETVWNGIIAIGTPVFNFLANVASAVWDATKAAWQRYGRPVAEFCLEVGGQILDFIRWCGEQLWEQIKENGRRLLALWRQYGAPIIERIGNAVIQFGGWVWRQVYDNGTAVLDVLIHASVELGQALQRATAAVWNAAKKLGAELQALWQAYGQPLVDALTAAAQRVGEIYERYGAPIVRRCLDAARRVGNAIWEGAQTIGQALWDMMTAVGETVYDWMRRAAVAAWKNLCDAGARVWSLAQRIGQTFYGYVERYGPQLIDLGRRMVEAQVQMIANAGAWLLDKVLATGFVILESIGQAGEGLINLIRDIPQLAGLIRDKGAAFGRMALEHGRAFVELIANSPALIYEICQRRGRAVIALFVQFGQRLVSLVTRLGETVIDIVLACGEWILSFLERLGRRVIDLWNAGGQAALNALQTAGEWGDWALSWIS